ncbi:MAG: HAMP domain-containing histidine kinase [Flavobacteriales bacterium]|nr:HAMP domain-containing histidine kinase [Flavobacteriales bacterium]MCB9166571.1 HAMP domain-containing histidine kinase [Flavobacteriales bacterium]MCB9194547.1 HAMP domain-containing histidine kinase [Flavobacteriales bacterium]
MSATEHRRPTPADASQAERLHRFSHDVRNKVGGLIEVLRSLPGTTSSEERRELEEFAERNIFAALHALEVLLDDLDVERGTPRLRRVVVDLAEVVRQTIDDVANRYARKEQHLEIALAPDVRVDGDPELLFQVVHALLTNASKFSPRKDAIHVAVTVEEQHAFLRITDHGVGLSDEDLEQVFARFAWLSSRSTEGESQSRGTLARARQWVEAHGGTLSAHSAGKGQGCTFTLRLPAVERLPS